MKRNNAKDLTIIKDMLQKHRILSGISFDHLFEFSDRIDQRLKPGQKELAFNTIRKRFRRACSEAAALGLCKKQYVGTSAYQTGDTLGGKVCIDYIAIEQT